MDKEDKLIRLAQNSVDGEPLANGIGVKGGYSILQNDKGEIVLIIDAHEDAPDDPRFIYDEGDTAVLFRSFGSSVAIRGIEKKAIDALKNVSDIRIVEANNGGIELEYVAPVRLVKSVKSLFNI